MTRTNQWVAAGIAAVLVVLAAGWFLVVSPRRADAAALHAEAVAGLGANERVRMQLQVLQAQADAAPEQQRRLAEVAEKIPDEVELPTLIRALTDAAEEGDVEFLSLVPGPASPLVPAAAPAAPVPVDGEAAAPAGPAAPAVGAAGTLHVVPVTINVAGGYYQIERYLAALEDLPRAVRIQGLSLAPGENPVALQDDKVTVDDGQTLTAALTGSVYVAVGRPAPLGVPAVPGTTTSGG